MTNQEKQQLNEKLARGAGFKQENYEVPSELGGIAMMVNGWISPEGEKLYGRIPNFTDSLDACFKWLVPKLDYYCLTPEDNGKGYYADASIGEDYAEYFQGETQALAFCLAVEKLIENGLSVY